MMEINELLKTTKTLKLLYVEDNKEAMEATLLIFNYLFFEVTTAVNGEEGYELFTKNEYDLVITDVRMPVLDGLSMANRIKKENHYPPIIILSAHNETDFLLKSIEIGIDGYLFKPINQNNLIIVLSKIIMNIKDKKDKQEIEKKQTELLNELNESKKNIEAIHKHTHDSIEYASLIQGALIPEKGILESYFKDHFVTWTPKDTVGGDIWLFDELRHEDECLLFFIDCTGHGVPGAFVTMIVKAVEREVVSKIKEHSEFDVSPAIIMAHFNKTMKTLLRQETEHSLSNVGFDGGIIYYNRKTQILKFAGAETPLFYTEVDGTLKTIKGNRYSVGYKKCDMNYEYKESILEVKDGMKFFCTTDGYLDQNGGERGFPFGKKRFKNIIKERYNEPMAELQTIFQLELMEYELAIEDNDRNDDITIIGFEIGKKSNKLEHTIDEILKYEGVMTQNVIATCLDNIETKITTLGIVGNISTITIEYCQNMMNYSKDDKVDSREIVPAGKIEVQYIDKEYYEITAINIVSTEDKQKIEPKLKEIQSLDKSGIKERYRELRRSGQNTHEKGGGIGLYEIAKVSNIIKYNFIAINNNKYQFMMQSVVIPKKR